MSTTSIMRRIFMVCSPRRSSCFSETNDFVRFFTVSLACLAACLVCACGARNSSTSTIPSIAAAAGDGRELTTSVDTRLLGAVTDAATSPYSALVLAADPLAYYKLNDGTVTMVDSGPHHLNGVYGANVRHSGTTLTSTGESSSNFPGSAVGANVWPDTGTVPANAVFSQASSAVSVEAWIRLADYNRTNNFVPIVSYGREGIGNVWALQLTPQTTLAFYMKVNGGSESYLVKSIQLVPAASYHVAATYDGATIRVYVNGIMTTSTAAHGTLNYAGFPPQYGFTVGGGTGGNSPAFDGSIADVSAYRTSLAPSTIQNHYITGHTAMVLTEQPADSDSFVDSIGVVTHLRASGAYTKSFSSFKTLLMNSGIRHIGDSLTSDPSWYVSEIKQLASAGIHASLITDPTQTAQTIAATIPAFGTAIEAVEGLNEPDKSGNANWVASTRRFQQMLWSTVKYNRTTAHLEVVGPSLTSITSDIALGNLSGYMDTGSLHDYFDGYNPGTPGWGSLSSYGVYGSLSYNRNIAAIVSGSRSLFSTETGFGNAATDRGGVDNRTLARYVPRLYLEHFLHGIKRTTTYEFYDEPGNGNFDDFGLVDLNNTPKSSYYAIRSLIAQLRDPGSLFSTTALHYTLGGDLANTQHLLLQKRDGTYQLVIWVEAPSYNPNSKTDLTVAPQTITLQPGGSPSATIGIIGDSGSLVTRSLGFTNGATSFTVDDHVSIISFK